VTGPIANPLLDEISLARAEGAFSDRTSPGPAHDLTLFELGTKRCGTAAA